MKRKIKNIFLLLLALLLAIAVLLTFSLRMSEPEERKHQLTVMTWNTHSLSQYAPIDRNEVVCYLREHPTDIICLQECAVLGNGKGISMKELKTAMAPYYPYSYYDFKIHNRRIQYGNIVYSRYPLINKRTVPYESQGNISSQCDVVVDGDTIALFVNHLESNRLAPSDIEHTDTLSHKINLARARRWEQAHALRQAIDSSRYTHLVVGDFNTPPYTLTYLYVRQMMQDCFLNGSNGKVGYTYYWHRIGVRIDYILADRSVDVVESHVDKNAKGSDHYPVWATVTFGSNENKTPNGYENENKEELIDW